MVTQQKEVERCVTTVTVETSKQSFYSNPSLLIILRDFVFRHVLMEDSPSANEETEHAYVNVLTRGDLSSLRWIASHLKYAPGSHGTTELCTVNYTSLNFRDIMLATGKLPPDALPGDLAQQDCILGMEFSGRNQKGERIMGLLPAQALATTVMADQRFTWKVSGVV